MSEQKRYTAQEMREVSNRMEQSGLQDEIYTVVGIGDPPRYLDYNGRDVVAMIRQAADAEEELIAHVEMHRKDADEINRAACENAQLKARLEAVVKECETEKSKWIPAMEYESVVKRSSMVDRYDCILRAARGDGGAV